MRAMVLEQPGPVESAPLLEREAPIPALGPGEVLVRVEACAVCRTDLHIVEGELPPHKLPVIPGHEAIGRVERVGEGVTALRPGDRVGAAWLYQSDQTCPYCQRGNENLGLDPLFTGYDRDGGYAEYMVARADFLHAVPEEVEANEFSPFLCAGIIGYRALKRSEVKPGQKLGLYGFGGSAHVVIQVARHWGCEVYVSSRDAAHRKLADEYGAVWTGDAEERPPAKLEAAILFAPVGHLVPPIMESLDRGGTLAVAGIYLTDLPGLHYETQLFHEKSLRSVTANTREDGRELLRLAAEIPLRSHTVAFPLSEANEALRRLKHDEIAGAAVLTIGDKGKPGA